MQIEVTGEAEKLLREAVSRSGFGTPMELIVSLLKREAVREGAATGLELPDSIHIAQAAAEQGVAPINNYRDLIANFWPADETADDTWPTGGSLRRLRF